MTAEELRADFLLRTGGWPDCYCCEESQMVEVASERLPSPSIFLIWRVHHRTGVGQLEPFRAFP